MNFVCADNINQNAEATDVSQAVYGSIRDPKAL
jgi:hypothetical protein